MIYCDHIWVEIQCWILLLRARYLLCHLRPYGWFSKIRSHLMVYPKFNELVYRKESSEYFFLRSHMGGHLRNGNIEFALSLALISYPWFMNQAALCSTISILFIRLWWCGSLCYPFIGPVYMHLNIYVQKYMTFLTRELG